MITKQQRNAGIIFMLLGAYVVYYAIFELNIGTIRSPGSGFFTLICGAGILILSTVLVVISLVKGAEDCPLWEEKGQWKKPALAMVVIFAYIILIPRLGFILATAAFIIVWGVIVEHDKPLRIAIFTVVATACMWGLFEKLMRVPLPNGILPW